MRTWIERVDLKRDNFAGREHDGVLPVLDRVKQMIADGWDLSVRIDPNGKEVIVLGWRE